MRTAILAGEIAVVRCSRYVEDGDEVSDFVLWRLDDRAKNHVAGKRRNWSAKFRDNKFKFGFHQWIYNDGFHLLRVKKSKD